MTNRAHNHSHCFAHQWCFVRQQVKKVYKLLSNPIWSLEEIPLKIPPRSVVSLPVCSLLKRCYPPPVKKRPSIRVSTIKSELSHSPSASLSPCFFQCHQLPSLLNFPHFPLLMSPSNTFSLLQSPSQNQQ